MLKQEFLFTNNLHMVKRCYLITLYLLVLWSGNEVLLDLGNPNDLMKPWKTLKDIMRSWRTEFQDDMTDIDFMDGVQSTRYETMPESNQIWGRVMFLDIGLPLVSKFFHDLVEW